MEALHSLQSIDSDAEASQRHHPYFKHSMQMEMTLRRSVRWTDALTCRYACNTKHTPDSAKFGQLPFVEVFVYWKL